REDLLAELVIDGVRQFGGDAEEVGVDGLFREVRRPFDDRLLTAGTGSQRQDQGTAGEGRSDAFELLHVLYSCGWDRVVTWCGRRRCRWNRGPTGWTWCRASGRCNSAGHDGLRPGGPAGPALCPDS